MTKPQKKLTPRRIEVLRKLHREILSARMKVALDEKGGRTPDDAVKYLADMKLPALPSRNYVDVHGVVGTPAMQREQSGTHRATAAYYH